jgi:hypothetical protein
MSPCSECRRDEADGLFIDDDGGATPMCTRCGTAAEAQRRRRAIRVVSTAPECGEPSPESEKP